MAETIDNNWELYLRNLEILQMAWFLQVINPAFTVPTCVTAAKNFYATAWPLI